MKAILRMVPVAVAVADSNAAAYWVAAVFVLVLLRILPPIGVIYPALGW